MNKPFEVDKKDGILTLTLNTPNARVNVFNADAATQVDEELRQMSHADTRAVVFRSSKPQSFINGAGLLLSTAIIKSIKDAVDRSEKIYMAYRRLRESVVPTVAVIQGNCYGGGLEFASNCHYRIAENHIDTQFSMPEIKNYLFLPGLGGTQNLPRLLGLEGAIQLLLWGQPLNASAAKRMGLLDKVFLSDQFEAHVGAFLRNLPQPLPVKKRRHAGRISKEGTRKAFQRACKRIAVLPPESQKLYSDGLHLMASSLVKRELSESDYRREHMKAIRSAMSPSSKSAVSFFFTRQMVNSSSSAQLSPSLNKKLESLSPSVKDSVPQLARENKIAMIFKLSTTQCVKKTLYSPFFGSRSRFIEIALGGPANSSARRLFTSLARIGCVPVFSHSSMFATNELLAAYFAPLINFYMQGGRVSSISYTLRNFGFSYLPERMIKKVGAASLSEVLVTSGWTHAPRKIIVRALMALQQATFRKGRNEQALVDALDVSLYSAVHRMLERGSMNHPASVDLMAREVLDFPLKRKSVCAYLTRERISSALPGAFRLVPHDVLQVCGTTLGRRPDFYLSC